jgi:hypothetical protein
VESAGLRPGRETNESTGTRVQVRQPDRQKVLRMNIIRDAWVGVKATVVQDRHMVTFTLSNKRFYTTVRGKVSPLQAFCN